MGSRQSRDLPISSYREWSKLLKVADLQNCDFEKAIADASKGDFLFVDPPYVSPKSQSIFVKYNPNQFSWEDQLRLRESLLRAKARGVQILMTNSPDNAVLKLYKADFYFKKIVRRSNLAAKSDFRGFAEELLVSSYPIELPKKTRGL